MAASPQATQRYPMRCYYCAEITYAVEVARVVNRPAPRRRGDGTSVLYTNDAGKRLVYVTILSKCSGCGGAVILGKDNEDIDKPGIYGIWPKEGDLWAPVVHADIAARLQDVPSALMREFGEARRCLTERCYTAAVVMVRRVLEGICRDLGLTNQPLAAALRAAWVRNAIDDRLAEWAQAIRAVGNDGAHFTGHQVEEDDARDAVDLCGAMLDHMYVVPAKAQQLQRRRHNTTQ